MKGEAKVGVVMGEFKRGTLRSGGSGETVTNPKQAVAIALSEARKAGATIPKKAPTRAERHQAIADGLAKRLAGKEF